MDTANELYRFVRALIDELRVTGYEALALRLESALNGTTSGEILDGLWFSLQDARGLSLGSDSVVDALEFIRHTLGPVR